MKYAEALLMKFGMTFVSLFIVLGLAFGVGVRDIFLISLVVTILGFAGDLIIYPRTSNKIATAGDLVLVFIVVWIMGALLITDADFSIVTAALFSAILIAVGEWFYHIYLSKRAFGHKETSHTIRRDEPRQS